MPSKFARSLFHRKGCSKLAGLALIFFAALAFIKLLTIPFSASLVRRPKVVDVAVQENKPLEQVEIEWMTKDEKNLIEDEFDLDYFKRLGESLRLFKKLHKYVLERPKSPRYDQMVNSAFNDLQKLEQHLFKWIRPSFPNTIELSKSIRGQKRGIVICVGNHHVPMVMATLRTLREVHKFNVPVEIFYTGDGDLSVKNRQRLESLPRIKTIDITRIFDNRVIRIESWALKPFAMLASSFAYPMLIDADVIFFQSPRVLFEDKLFQKTGALFFTDRTIFEASNKTIGMFRALMPEKPSEYSLSLNIFNGKTGHQQESGVVLIDKKKNLMGLLAACVLNVGSIRKFVYSRVWGDKETFWLGFETMQDTFAFSGGLPGSAGVSKISTNGKYELCARQLIHVDEFRRPLWANGGIVDLKHDPHSKLALMTEFLIEPGKWEILENNLGCLKADHPPIEFSDRYLSVIEKSGKIYLQERYSSQNGSVFSKMWKKLSAFFRKTE